MTDALLTIKNVSAGYGGDDVLHDISFELKSGEIFALVGESGSGKSTILKIITGLDSSGVHFSDGTVTFKGRDMSTLTTEERRRLLGEKICTVSQNPSQTMNSIRKIRKQFMETIRSHRSVEKADAIAMISTAFGKLGLGDTARILDCCPFELSGGMCQRVVLALAMVMKPELMLADEPTSALDVMSQRQMIDELRLLRESCGTSIILVTHNIALASQIADKIAIMLSGRIVEHGETVRVLSSPEHTYTKKLLSDVPRIRSVFPVYSFGVPLLEVTGVSKSYAVGEKQVDAVRNVSFTLSRGEVLGVVGESGSGKSTLSRQLLRLERPDSGNIVFDGTKISGIGKRELRSLYRRAQMVFQVPAASFDRRRTVRSTLRDAVRNLTDKKTSAEVDGYIDELMERVGLAPEMADRYPWELSGGQCQRAAIARAISAEPDMLICDEATSALDVSVQAQIAELLNSLVRQRDMSMIFISHDIALVSGLCDTIMVMRNGKCVELGPTERIITSPKSEYTKALLETAALI
ncbi:MAG: ABC transporter ATP-binding protein [Dethiobacteria bacterium]|jgi:peptide/nickel transport system ATP-binding protein